MNTIRYRDYQGAVEFDSDKLLIRILHIDDLITTEVDRASEVEAAFAELVEDYIATCGELGKEPSKPFKGLFNVRVPPELHKQAAYAAASGDVTLNAYVIAALEDKLAPTAFANDHAQVTHPPFDGFLRLSLVTCPIRLHPAAEDDHHLHLDDDEEATIEIEHFAPKSEIDPVYLSAPYYLVPSGAVGHDAYAVIRETLSATKMIAIARIGKHMMTIEPRGTGMVCMLLRNVDQVRDPRDLFNSIQNVNVTKDMIDLATHIVKQMAGHFDPQKARPKKRKKVSQEGAKPAISPAGGNVIDLMEALRGSWRRKPAPHQDTGAPRRKA